MATPEARADIRSAFIDQPGTLGGLPGRPATTALGQAQVRPRTAPAEVTPFEAIYRDYFAFVWSSVRRLGVSPAATDDVVQEVFIVIHSRLHTLKRREALRSWIYGVVRRTVSDHHRSRRVRLALGATLAAQPNAPWPPTPSDLAEQNDDVKLLWSLVQELDESKRELFVMVELDELTVPEVAEILGIPLNTAYSRLRAAREAFEEALARHSARREQQGGGGRWRG